MRGRRHDVMMMMLNDDAMMMLNDASELIVAYWVIRRIMTTDLDQRT
jgi:hypothetical protein